MEMCIIASGERVILRDRLSSDLDSYFRWQTSGEWRLYDAPWEGVRTSMMVRDWVDRYANERFPDAWLVTIDVCEDAYLNQGIGTQALRLWIGYLFSNSDVHRIGLDTWSFNERTVRVAEKLGFAYEGAQRELVEWQGKWLDLAHYGMLRSRWEDRCTLYGTIAAHTSPTGD
jgi:RimJ/RimL family protein N-acetyltransferase